MNSTEAAAHIRVAIAWGYLAEEEAAEATAAIDKLGGQNLDARDPQRRYS